MAPSPPSAEILQRTQSLFTSPRLNGDYAQLGMQEPAGLFGFYMLDDAGLRKFSAGAQINTDDRTLLEYHAPRSLLVHGLEDKNRDAILQEQKNPLPEDFPQNARDASLAAAAETSVIQEDGDGAERFLHALDNRPASAAIQIIRGKAALAEANFQTSLHAFDAALVIDPGSLDAAWGVAESNRRFGNNQKARQMFEEILTRDPKNLQALTSLSKLEFDFSRWSEAEDLQRRIMHAEPHPGAAAHAQLAEILLHEGKLDEAYSASMDALAEDPYSYQAHMSLGKLLAQQGKWAEARTHLEFVMRFFPDENSEVYPLLFKADKNLGDSAAAAKAVKFGLRVFPDNSELQRLKPLV
jgi:tetratricopeptide (TPR) repeat protein